MVPSGLKLDSTALVLLPGGWAWSGEALARVTERRSILPPKIGRSSKPGARSEKPSLGFRVLRAMRVPKMKSVKRNRATQALLRSRAMMMMPGVKDAPQTLKMQLCAQTTLKSLPFRNVTSLWGSDTRPAAALTQSSEGFLTFSCSLLEMQNGGCSTNTPARILTKEVSKHCNKNLNKKFLFCFTLWIQRSSQIWIFPEGCPAWGQSPHTFLYTSFEMPKRRDVSIYPSFFLLQLNKISNLIWVKYFTL